MATEITTITTPNGLYKPTILSKKLLKNFDENSVWFDCINRDYEGEIKYAGDTVKINQPGDVGVRSYTKYGTMTYDQTEGNQRVLLIDQQQYFGFTIDDVDDKQANITLVDKYMDRAKTAVTLKKDGHIFTKAKAGLIEANEIGSQALSADTVYSYFVKLRNKLTWAKVLKQNGKGFDGKAPFAVIDPDVESLILQAPQTIHPTNAGDETVRKGALYNFAGFDIKVSTNTENTSHTIIAGTTDGITYADQILKVRTLEDINNFGKYVSGLYVYGCLVSQPDCLAGGIVTI